MSEIVIKTASSELYNQLRLFLSTTSTKGFTIILLLIHSPKQWAGALIKSKKAKHWIFISNNFWISFGLNLSVGTRPDFKRLPLMRNVWLKGRYSWQACMLELICWKDISIKLKIMMCILFVQPQNECDILIIKTNQSRSCGTACNDIMVSFFPLFHRSGVACTLFLQVYCQHSINKEFIKMTIVAADGTASHLLKHISYFSHPCSKMTSSFGI